jgi:ABC-type histidine transport system ATPase subunit
MVFQHFELFPHLSVTENLTLAQIKVLGRGAEEAKTRGRKIKPQVVVSPKRASSTSRRSVLFRRVPSSCIWVSGIDWYPCELSTRY